MTVLAVLWMYLATWAQPNEGRLHPLLDVQLVEQEGFKRNAMTPFQDDLVLKATLYNSSNDTLRFLTWKCSFADYFELKNAKGYRIQQDICEKNYLEVIELAPNEKWVKYIGLLRNNYVEQPSLQCSVGFKFIAIDEKQLPELNWLKAREKESATIWSKTVYLPT